MLRQWNLRFVSVNGSPLFLPYEYYNNVFKIPESKNIVPWHGGWGSVGESIEGLHGRRKRIFRNLRKRIVPRIFPEEFYTNLA